MKDPAPSRATEVEDLDEPRNDPSSVCNTSTVDLSSRDDTPNQRRRHGRKPAPAHRGLEIRCSAHARRKHGRPLFGVQFNPHLRSCSEQAVATC